MQAGTLGTIPSAIGFQSLDSRRNILMHDLVPREYFGQSLRSSDRTGAFYDALPRH
jgi:hypothetical protein